MWVIARGWFYLFRLFGWGDAIVYEPSVVVKEYPATWKKPTKRQVSLEEAGVSTK
jgi:hypothetical protein